MISIIVPMYNAQDTIASCVQSVLEQREEEWELIVVNDGSNDESVLRCRQYNDPRLHLIQGERGGVSKARNTGLAYAKGEWIMFLDSDDKLLPLALTTLLSLAKDKDIVMGGHTTTFPAQAQKGDEHPILHLNSPKEIAQYCMTHRFEVKVGSVWAKLYRASLLKGKKFPEGIQFAEDNLFNLPVYAQAQSVCITSTPVYYYHTHRHSLSYSLSNQSIVGINDLYYQWLQFLAPYSLDTEGRKCSAFYLNLCIHLLKSQVHYRPFPQAVQAVKQVMADATFSKAIANYDKEEITTKCAKLTLPFLQKGNACMATFLLKMVAGQEKW